MSAVSIRSARPEDAPLIAAVQVTTWRTTYNGLVPEAYLAQMSVQQRAERLHFTLTNPNSHVAYFVAETETGEVVGFACGGPERDGHAVYKGELYAIYLLQAYQGQGIGRRLVQTVAGWLEAGHYPNLLIWVLAGNESGIRFYEALGGVRVGRKPLDIQGAALEEYAYGWTTLKGLLADVRISR
ncbi:MAG: GNAT family N-acetyltransferase [Anaerolineae bacterium]|nr:GNAT family N-acetyltransferase [Anaerolineae bacterium]